MRVAQPILIRILQVSHDHRLGHSDPSITLRTYAHALPAQEGDLEFASFGAPKRVLCGPGVLATRRRNVASPQKDWRPREDSNL
jgi:hypothetical protein